MENDSNVGVVRQFLDKVVVRLMGDSWVQAEELARGRGIDVALVDAFMLERKGNFSEAFTAVSAITTAIGAGLGFAFAATKLAETPGLQVMPEWLDRGLNFLHGLRAGAAENATWLAHLPPLLLDVGILGTLVGTAAVVATNAIGGRVIENGRRLVGNLIENGYDDTASYRLPDKHTVLVAFNGDDVADAIARDRENGTDALLYQNTRPDASKPWIKTEIGMSMDGLNRALKCGGASNAGEIILFSTRKEDAIFARDGGLEHPMGDIQLFVAKLRAALNEIHNNSRIIMVANKHVREKGTTSVMDTESGRTNAEDLPDEYARKIVDLERLGVTFVDPSELVANALLIMAQGKTLKMVATSTGSSRYKDMSLVYLTEGQSRHMVIPKSEGELEFVCDVSDGDVLSWTKDDKNSGEKRVYIVQSKDAYTLITGEQYNIPEDRVIFVPKLVKEKLDKLRHPVEQNN